CKHHSSLHACRRFSRLSLFPVLLVAQVLHESYASSFYKSCKSQEHKHKAGGEATAPERGPSHRQGPAVLTGHRGCPPPAGSAAAPLCALGTLLSLLVPVQATRSPDCGGILTPSGLSYIAEVSRPYAEMVLRQDLLEPRALDLPLGSPKASRDQISSVRVVDLSLSLVPEAGLRLGIEVDLGIAPPAAAPRLARLSILADLHVDLSPDGDLQLTTSSCRPTVEEVQSAEEVESKSSSSDLDKEINADKICLEVSKLLLFPNEQLMSLTAQFPITPSCQVQYLPLAAPVISEEGITMSLQVSTTSFPSCPAPAHALTACRIPALDEQLLSTCRTRRAPQAPRPLLCPLQTTFQVAGRAVPLPVSPVPFSMPELVSSSPSHLTLALSEHFYTSLFFALERAGAFNMTILSPLTTATMAQKITQVGSLYPEDLPVMLRAEVRSSPRVELEEGRAALKLFLTVHVGAGSPDFQSFLSVSADVTAGLLLSITDTQMMISAAVIEDAELSLAASDVGPVPAALLEELFLGTVREEVPVWMNAVLSEGVHLPHISSFTYTDVSIMIHKVRNQTCKSLPETRHLSCSLLHLI
ncbi:LOW QUALITY PROTEIN: BPI fold-containing family B member 2, partial [Oxyura jamaicensis]|uniref:LOW QUALITY PROTEIN: BPI fold-containing family B member 2 n=1 Tax=Oxyura jamaicensis TaxID=8884 RepID=UPI0015A6C6F4